MSTLIDSDLISFSLGDNASTFIVGGTSKLLVAKTTSAVPFSSASTPNTSTFIVGGTSKLLVAKTTSALRFYSPLFEASGDGEGAASGPNQVWVG